MADSPPPSKEPPIPRKMPQRKQNGALDNVLNKLLGYVQALYAFLYLFFTSLLEPLLGAGNNKGNNKKDDDQRRGGSGGKRGGFGSSNYSGGVSFPSACGPTS